MILAAYTTSGHKLGASGRKTIQEASSCVGALVGATPPDFFVGGISWLAISALSSFFAGKT